ncbi:hypothetical protein EMPS_09741 [Entomortierella parvispora]|uniref:Uncharacterized protein n=1 Tax=Entomortierella parvispora TaxID=205924 RepID=A0A9P3HIR2_9FUNG|nr:hypothetical protein EMPS_09741 [Entomortierella parvispora]
MAYLLQSPFCLASDGHSIFGTGFAYNLDQDKTIFHTSYYPDWLVLIQSTSTRVPSVLASSPFYNITFLDEMDNLNWTIVFSTPRATVNLFPNTSYAFSCGTSSDGYFALRAQSFPELSVQLSPSLLIRLPTTNPTRNQVDDDSTNGDSDDSISLGDDNTARKSQVLNLPYGVSDHSLPLLTLGMWTGLESHQSTNWYSQPGSAAALVAFSSIDISTVNCTNDDNAGEEEGGTSDLSEWVQIWSTCATDMSSLDQIEIQIAVSRNGVFPTIPQTTWKLQNPEHLGHRTAASRCPIHVTNSRLFVLSQSSGRTWVSVLPLSRILVQGKDGLKTIAFPPPDQATDNLLTVELPPQLDCVNNDRSMISSLGDMIHVLCFNSTSSTPNLHVMFNVTTNTSTTRKIVPAPYQVLTLDWPLTARLYPSMWPLYHNAEGLALNILYSRGYFEDSDHNGLGGHGLQATGLSQNWTAISYSYYVDVLSSNSDGQVGQNFSVTPAYTPSDFDSLNPNETPNMTATQVIVIAFFSVVLSWIVYGLVLCFKKKRKKILAENGDFNVNTSVHQIEKDKYRNRKKKNKKKTRNPRSKQSTRTKSRAWSIVSWKWGRKREGNFDPEIGHARALPGQADQEEGMDEDEEHDMGQGSNEPPGSKICESEETHDFTLATGSNLGTSAATAIGVTVIHGGMDDSRPMPFRRPNARRVIASENSSGTTLDVDQPTDPTYQARISSRFTGPSAFLPLRRHQIRSVVTSLSPQSHQEPHPRLEEGIQSSLSSTSTTPTVALPGSSAMEGHLALTSISIEGVRSIPLLTGISAAPFPSIPMSVISSTEHPPQPNQPGWMRTNAIPRAHLTISTSRTTGTSSTSSPAAPALALPSAPPVP